MAVEHRERAAAGGARGALVFFHGFYGVPDDFLAFVDKIDPGRRLQAYLPQGPWPMSDGRSSWLNPDHAREASSDLEPVFHWLDSLPFAPEETVYGGWSQGARVAYEAGLRHPRRPAAILALGGRLPDPAALDLTAPLPPVLIAHGRDDHSVPVEHARHAHGVLSTAGAAVTYLETAVGHEIDQSVIPRVREFLAHALPDPVS
jgi:phospholipase/carboxylesterase